MSASVRIVALKIGESAAAALYRGSLQIILPASPAARQAILFKRYLPMKQYSSTGSKISRIRTALHTAQCSTHRISAKVSDGRCAHLTDDALEQRLQVLGQLRGVVAGDAVSPAGIDHREVALFIGGAEIHEQVESGVDDKVRPAVQPAGLQAC